MEAKEFSALRISLASPDQIEKWSYGEVTKPETINYRRLRPEKDGLFCEAIFGPTRDWQCYCGKYKNLRYRGIVCDKCGVEVTRSSVRRERMGHIQLAAPVAHVWYTRRVPSYLGLLLDVSRRNLDRVLYFAQYVITNVDEDARKKALMRVERELARHEMLRGGDLHERMAELTDTRDTFVASVEDRKAEIHSVHDEELAQLSDELMQEAQKLHQRIEGMQGEKAPAPVVLEATGEVIVAEGTEVGADHLTGIQKAINDQLGEIQEGIEARRRQQLADLAEQEKRLVTETEHELTELRDQLNEMMATVRHRADNARRELQDLAVLQFLSETRFRQLKNRYGRVFQANMGAEAFYEILKNMDLERLSLELWQEVRESRSMQRKKKATKRLKVVESLRNSQNRPEWMIMTMLPVIPPDLRPMVQLDGGRFATSDLNDLYRRVINRNNRLKRLLELGAPDVIVRNEKRMLQEAVDSLVDNSQRGKELSRRGRRELKSLSDMLKGKKGRFRRNLLGKRVDYSGRSVIVIGPRLKLHQCGLPKTMALELYRPFVISRLVNQNYASNVRGARRIIERERPEVWEALEEVIQDRPVLLNRAPTLHRLGIQAFEPLLVEGKAIQIHPLVCSAFNADFDGDQMAVHVPLSEKAVQEARELMLSTRNLLKPADGSPIVGPSKDMVLGCYYLTMDPTVEILALKTRAEEFRSIEAVTNDGVRVGVALRSNGYYHALQRGLDNIVLFPPVTEEDDTGRVRVIETAIDRTVRAVLEGEVDCTLANAYEARKYLRQHGLEDRLEIANLHERRLVVDMDEVQYLYHLGMVDLHTPILLGNIYDDQPPREEAEATTVGRALFNRILPDEMRFVQETLGKRGLNDLVALCYQRIGSELTTGVVDQIKNFGFHYATISGTTVAVSDLTIPDERARILDSAEDTVVRAERDFRRGLLTEEERYQITIDEWTNAKNELQDSIRDTLDPYGPIAIMALSGSTKGGFGPITQLAGMRGLMADPSGRIIEMPIKSHFRQGLTALEYFISTHGARKGLADTALRTADAGYLTRRLVDVAQDVIVNRSDCGTEAGMLVSRAQDIAGQTMQERTVGRIAAEPVYHPETGELIVDHNEMIDEDIALRIEQSDVEEVYVRSPMTCSLIHGICALCYGRDLGRGEMVGIGAAVGIVAAQSIGEPGTQLTLRTFHTGGIHETSGDITSGLPRVEELFEARKKPRGEAVIVDIGGIVRLGRRSGVRIATVIDEQVDKEEHVLPQGWELLVEEDQEVRPGDTLARPTGQVFQLPEGGELQAEEDGQARPGNTLARAEDAMEQNLTAGMQGRVHLEGDRITVVWRHRHEEEYEIPSSARLTPEVYDGAGVHPGQQLTEGASNPHRILRILGEEATRLYLLSEVQKVYRNQGVNIADKHFEIMIRKMLSKVQITDSGDSDLLPDELVDRLLLLDINDKLVAEDRKPATGTPELLGISRAALSTESFLSASSFQHTIKVLAGAAIEGKKDKLFGLKENVIIGKLIPAGTGFHTYQDRELVSPEVSLDDQGALLIEEFDENVDVDALLDGVVEGADEKLAEVTGDVNGSMDGMEDDDADGASDLIV